MQLSIYTTQFVEAATNIIKFRLKTIESWLPKFTEAVSKISENSLLAGMNYIFKDLAPETTAEVYAEHLKDALQKKKMLEKMRGRTLVGPHTDDLSLLLSDRPARHFASQGETRALVLALKIAEVRLLAEKRGEAPILLLDDVCGELDHDRVQALFNVADEVCSQIFVTTPHEDDLPPHWQGRFFN